MTDEDKIQIARTVIHEATDTMRKYIARIQTLEEAMREIINQGQMFPYSAVSFRRIQKIAHKALEKKK